MRTDRSPDIARHVDHGCDRSMREDDDSWQVSSERKQANNVSMKAKSTGRSGCRYCRANSGAMTLGCDETFPFETSNLVGDD